MSQEAEPPTGESDLPSNALILVESELDRLGNENPTIHELATEQGRLYIAGRIAILDYLKGLKLRLLKQQGKAN